MNKRIIYGIIIIALVVAAGVGGWYIVTRESSPSTPPSSTNQPAQTDKNQSTTTPPAEQTPPVKTYAVNVYFSRHPDSDNDPSKVFAVPRTASDLGLGKFAMTELLKGPTVTEKTQGYFTTARLRAGDSSCGGSDFTLAVNSGIATLKFCRQFDHLGVVADGQADSEIKATLKQFSTVQKVVILNQRGDCEFDLSGLNLCKQ